MCFLRLGGGRCLKFLSSSPGQEIYFPRWFLHADGRYPANECVWDGTNEKNVEKIRVICCLSDLLTRSKIKFTKNISMWAIKDCVSFLRNTKYSGC